jgi:ribA/ribD-fused uncharacterized protein
MPSSKHAPKLTSGKPDTFWAKFKQKNGLSEDTILTVFGSGGKRPAAYGDEIIFTNFYAGGCPVVLDGVAYPTAEHAFQAAKTTYRLPATPDNECRQRLFADTRARVLSASCGSEAAACTAKRADGRRTGARALPAFPMNKEELAAWDAASEEAMDKILRAKFAPGSAEADALLATNDTYIVERAANKRWGCGTSATGANGLGKALMKRRAQLRQLGGVE